MFLTSFKYSGVFYKLYKINMHKLCFVFHHKVQPPLDLEKLFYFSQDDYIATLEGTVERAAKHSSHFNVRVYINWTADLTEHPIRARVAGDLTSMRYSKC